MTEKTPLTLRQLCSLLGEEFMDVPLQINVRDGNMNVEQVAGPADLWQLPRANAIASTGEPARLAFQVYLDRHRLVTRNRR